MIIQTYNIDEAFQYGNGAYLEAVEMVPEARIRANWKSDGMRQVDADIQATAMSCIRLLKTPENGVICISASNCFIHSNNYIHYSEKILHYCLYDGVTVITVRKKDYSFWIACIPSKLFLPVGMFILALSSDLGFHVIGKRSSTHFNSTTKPHSFFFSNAIYTTFTLFMTWLHISPFMLKDVTYTENPSNIVCFIYLVIVYTLIASSSPIHIVVLSYNTFIVSWGTTKNNITTPEQEITTRTR